MPDNKQNTLYYIHDPMCSWCWGFKPVLAQLEQGLTKDIDVQYVLGGLAQDSDQPMPDEMQHFLQQTWHNIEKKIPGTVFNFEFWTNCQPRRSTYPACRAVIAAKKQNPAIEKAMIIAIQEAYYLQAKNPSDEQTLVKLAADLELDSEQFLRDISSQETQAALLSEIKLAHQLGAQGFPSLVLKTQNNTVLLNLDYLNADVMLQQINELLT